MLKFDDYSFRQTARAVIQLNPHASNRFDVEGMESFMRGFASLYLADKPSHGGTFGFYISTSHHAGVHPMVAVATVCPSLVVGLTYG